MWGSYLKVSNSYLVVIRVKKKRERIEFYNTYAYFLPDEVQGKVPVYVEQEQRLGRMRSAPMESSFCWSIWSKLVASRADNELPRPGEKTLFSCTESRAENRKSRNYAIDEILT